MDMDVIIILSDDEESEKQSSSDWGPHNQPSMLDDSSVLNDSSVLIIEEVTKAVPDCPMSPSEDLVITFSQRADVLPHARYDCCTHPFILTDGDTDAPAGSNQLICDQCFCYVCDKLASQCTVWCAKGICHCNSHKRSAYWSSLRDKVILGYLKAFNFNLMEIDTQLRHAESMLIRFEEELTAEYSVFLRGRLAEEEIAAGNISAQTNYQVLHVRLHDYTPVFECVSTFLNQADKQKDRAAAIMRLGAAQHFIRHRQPPGVVVATSPHGRVEEAVLIQLQRVLDEVRRQMVMTDFSPDFLIKLEDFFKRIPILPKWRTMKNSLSARSWADPLLVSVLRGQNVSGVRKEKNRRDVLVESEAVVLLRTERLEQQHRYRELCRYLRVVQTDYSEQVQGVRDLIPLFLLKAGDFKEALLSFFTRPSCPACRLSPQLFVIYLRILTTATSPSVTTGIATQPRPLDDQWEPIAGAVAQSRVEVVKFALRVQQVCPAIYNNSACWSCILQIVNSPSDSGGSLEEPHSTFQQEARAVAKSILGSNMQVPRSFQSAYPDQALLLLVTHALTLRLLSAPPLQSVLPVINPFKVNLLVSSRLVAPCPQRANGSRRGNSRPSHLVVRDMTVSSVYPLSPCPPRGQDNVWGFRWLCEGLSRFPPVFLSFIEGANQELNDITDMASPSPESEPQTKTLLDLSRCNGPEASKPFPCHLKTVSRCNLPDQLWKSYQS